MDRMVRVFAPKGVADGIVKAAGLLVFVVVLNIAFETILGGKTAADYGIESLVACSVGLPMIVLALMLLRHMRGLQDDLARVAATDMLTGLANRRAFMAAADRIFGTSGGMMLMVDVDRFKRVNDTYGHAVGDICLRAIARHLRDLAGADDIVARIGGEEFAALLPHADLDRATAIGTRLADGTPVGEAEHPGVTTLRVRSSVGVVSIADCRTVSVMMRRADEALYRAKRQGRGQVVVWTHGMEHGLAASPHLAAM